MAWLLLSTQTQETLVSRIIPEGFIERMNMQVKHFRCFIAWRHAYENEGGVIDAVVRSKWGLVTVSRGGRLLRSWDVSSGVLRWESLTGLSSKAEQLEYPLNADWRPGVWLPPLLAPQLVSHVTSPGHLIGPNVQ